MSGFEFEPCKLSHEVEFGWPDIAVRALKQFRSPFALFKGEVVRDNVLGEHIVGVQENVTGLGLADHCLPVRRELVHVGHP